MADVPYISVNTLGLAVKRLAALLEAVADPHLSFLADQALANPAVLGEFVAHYRHIEREHDALKVKFASLLAVRSVGAEGTDQRSDGIASLFDQFKKTEQQIFRSLVNTLVQHVVNSSDHPIAAAALRTLRYEIMAALSETLLLKPFRSLTDEGGLSEEQLAKLTQPIRKAVLNASAVVDGLSADDPIYQDLSAFLEKQVAEAVANGLARLRSKRPIDQTALAELAADATEVIRNVYKVPKQASQLLEDVRTTATTCVELAYQLTRSNVACILWLPERGTPFNPAAHRVAAGTTEGGSIRLALFPALTIGGRVVERALVLTDAGSTAPAPSDL